MAQQVLNSFYQDNNSTTFGSLIGVSNILELSRRSLRRAKIKGLKRKRCKKSKSRSWTHGYYVCAEVASSTSSNPDAENNPPSLGQFLALERRSC
ncbi:hypothetical protein AAZX31_11G136300 [Glycine max]